MTLNDAAEQDKAFYLKEIDGGLKLKTNHLYHWQFQGVMNIVGLPCTAFIVFTTKDFNFNFNVNLLPGLLLRATKLENLQ